MGEIFIDLVVSNLRNPERQREIAFLVDTGATRAWISEEIAAALGIEEALTVPVELADGTIKEFPYGFCLFTFGDETVAGNVIIGPPVSEPLAGTHVLQDFRVVIDMERHAISRSRALRAK